MNMYEYVTIEQACGLLGISRATFYAWTYRGFIPPGERRGRFVVWPRSVILAAIERRDGTAVRPTGEHRAILT